MMKQAESVKFREVKLLDPVFAEHSHASAEIIGFFGSDPEDAHELHGDIRVLLDG